MAGEKKRLLENFLSLGALQIISYVIPLITLPYLARVLSVGNFGLVFFAFAFMQYFIILTDYGFGLSATREIAVNRHNKNNISNIFNSVTCIKALLLLVSFFTLLVSICFIPKLRTDWIVFILSFFMVVVNAIYPVWFFQGMERMKYITFLNSSSSFCIFLNNSIFSSCLHIFSSISSFVIFSSFSSSIGISLFLLSFFIFPYHMYFAIWHSHVEILHSPLKFIYVFYCY